MRVWSIPEIRSALIEATAAKLAEIGKWARDQERRERKRKRKRFNPLLAREALKTFSDVLLHFSNARCLADLELISNLGVVTDVSLNGVMTIITNPITIGTTWKGKRLDIHKSGTYKVQLCFLSPDPPLNYNGSWVPYPPGFYANEPCRIFEHKSTRPTKCDGWGFGYYHPHVPRRGYPCLGGFGKLIVKPLQEGEIGKACLAVLSYLKHCEPDDHLTWFGPKLLIKHKIMGHGDLCIFHESDFVYCNPCKGRCGVTRCKYYREPEKRKNK